MSMNYREHRYTSHDGLSLYYRQYGTGDHAVLCLPGLTRNCKDFEGLATNLSADYRVITPDLRGRGQSDRDPNWKQYLPPTYVRDTWTLMDELGLERVSIIGTSLGGLMAMIMANQQPQRLRSVVLNDIGPEVPVAATVRLLEYVGRTPPQPDWASAAELNRKNYEIAYPDEAQAFWDRQARAAWRQREDGQVLPDYDPAIGDSARRVAKLGGLIRLLQRFGVRRLQGINLDPWDNFNSMDMPVLVLRGAHSDILTTDTLEKMRRARPQLEVVEIPGRGHAPTFEEAPARAAIGRFLAAV
jgi:pimeloyl-ACP methyl ester carboxylesterase